MNLSLKPVIVAYVAAAAILAAAFPLLVYSTTLAAFGLAHVATELWYVDHRFGRRVRMELVVGALVLLSIVVVTRALSITRVIPSADALVIELCLVCALGSLALPALLRRGPLVFAVGVVVVGGLALGTLVVPAMTLTFLAITHNATPVGFLVERAPPHLRMRTIALSSLAFFGVPLLVASGVVGDALEVLGLRAVSFSVLPTGPLRDHLFVYLPRSLHSLDSAPDLFAAVVCAQVLHYGAVIGLLPRLVDDTDQPRAPWPPARVCIVVLVALAAGLIVHFSLAFADARALYGLAAGVHAWIEVPVLLLALAGVTSVGFEKGARR